MAWTASRHGGKAHPRRFPRLGPAIGFRQPPFSRWTTRPRRAGLAILLLAALLWQGILVQTHVHAAAAPTTATATRVAAPHLPADDPATCPLCRAVAQAGRYLPADPPRLPCPPAARPVRCRLPGRRWRTRKRSHAWHSRGPPARVA